ncbi:hypothetical protein SNEBB_008072 [Seison nebaliae]|nr:hypothetical protein SNEBB_008072 [Seison nebaliae]
MKNEQFNFGVWGTLTIANWLFDFCRPIVMILTAKWFPLNRPSLGDYFHMAYNVVVGMCLYKMWSPSEDKNKNLPLKRMFKIGLVAVFVMGASIHLVGDSINHRLTMEGYELHKDVRSNQFMSNQTEAMIETFELLYFYDEIFGHNLWYFAYFLEFFLYFNTNCFSNKVSDSSSNYSLFSNKYYFVFVVINALYYLYLVTEGQIIILFSFTYICMRIADVKKRLSKQHINQNGKFMIDFFKWTILFLIVWKSCFQGETRLYEKYKDMWIFLPEPWTLRSLYLSDSSIIQTKMDIMKHVEPINQMVEEKIVDSTQLGKILDELQKAKVDRKSLQASGLGVKLNLLYKTSTDEKIRKSIQNTFRAWKEQIKKTRNEKRKVVNDHSSVPSSDQPKKMKQEIEPEEKKKVEKVSTTEDEEELPFVEPPRNTLRDKLIDSMLKDNEIVTDRNNIRKLAAEIEEKIYTKFPTKQQYYRSDIMSRISNLRTNKGLRADVIAKVISVDDFLKMTHKEMATESLREERKIMTKQSIDQYQIAVRQGTKTNVLNCKKCRSNNCFYNQVQTRSADEPMTTFVYCANCGFRWKFN